MGKFNRTASSSTALGFRAGAAGHCGVRKAGKTMRLRGNSERPNGRMLSEDEALFEIVRRSASPAEDVSPGEALTLEQTVEVLQRLRSLQKPGSSVSLYLDARPGG